MHTKTLLLTFLAANSLATAEPAWKMGLTPASAGTFSKITSCSLSLNVSWKGMIDSGKLTIDFAPKDSKKSNSIIVRSTASSLGLAASLFPYHSNFWSEIDPTSLMPLFFHAVETDDKESVTTTTRFFSNRVECREITSLLKKGTEVQKDRVFNFVPAFDMFSAMLYVRSQKLDVGDQITIVVHPFDNPYLLRVKVIARESHLDRKTIRLSVGMNKIDRKTLELKPYKKLKSDATLWLSDDSDRIPVEFRAAVFIGDVRATLSSFQKN
ncbi:MAG: DUF3108 domain-containing protein [Gloeobacteraceae cyanobacterium ES-bin-144]|nr:DUF3108 domain-containing protein [Verrucomicrobiales bacterium]